MNRINVSDEWRISHTDTDFEMKFACKVNKDKVLETIRAAIEEIKDEYGYYALWLQDLEDCTMENGFDIASTLMSDEFCRYIPAMCKAVATALPGIPFSGSACHDSLKCYYIDSFEFTCDGSTLHIKETFKDDDCGYFCPECGELIALADEAFDEEEIICEDCDEVIKVSDLKFIPPVVTEETFIKNA